MPIAVAADSEAFIRQVIRDANAISPTVTDRTLEPKLLGAYKRALKINEKENCNDTPDIGGYLNEQDGRELKSVRVLSDDNKTARVRVGFGPLNSHNDTVFELMKIGSAWKIYDFKGVHDKLGFRANYLNWKCEAPIK
jgi:hypothetical protein